MADNITIDITRNETILTEASIDISIKLCPFSLWYLNNYFKVIEMQLENLRFRMQRKSLRFRF